MSNQIDLQSLTVFDAEIRGRTLIVTPRGDAAGFNSSEMHREAYALHYEIEQPDVACVLVDLGPVGYIGSLMIGTINAILAKARELKKPCGVCGVGDDLRGVLDVMHLSEHWNIYDDRKEAMAELSTETFAQRAVGGVRDHSKAVVWSVLFLAAVVGALLYWFRPGYDVERATLASLNGIHEEFKSLRAANATEPQWKLFTARTERDRAGLLRDLKRFQKRTGPSWVNLVLAAQNSLPKMVKTARKEPNEAERAFELNLEIARRRLDGETITAELLERLAVNSDAAEKLGDSDSEFSQDDDSKPPSPQVIPPPSGSDSEQDDGNVSRDR